MAQLIAKITFNQIANTETQPDLIEELRKNPVISKKSKQDGGLGKILLNTELAQKALNYSNEATVLTVKDLASLYELAQLCKKGGKTPKADSPATVNINPNMNQYALCLALILREEALNSTQADLERYLKLARTELANLIDEEALDDQVTEIADARTRQTSLRAALAVKLQPNNELPAPSPAKLTPEPITATEAVTVPSEQPKAKEKQEETLISPAPITVVPGINSSVIDLNQQRRNAAESFARSQPPVPPRAAINPDMRPQPSDTKKYFNLAVRNFAEAVKVGVVPGGMLAVGVFILVAVPFDPLVTKVIGGILTGTGGAGSLIAASNVLKGLWYSARCGFSLAKACVAGLKTRFDKFLTSRDNDYIQVDTYTERAEKENLLGTQDKTSVSINYQATEPANDSLAQRALNQPTQNLFSPPSNKKKFGVPVMPVAQPVAAEQQEQRTLSPKK